MKERDSPWQPSILLFPAAAAALGRAAVAHAEQLGRDTACFNLGQDKVGNVEFFFTPSFIFSNQSCIVSKLAYHKLNCISSLSRFYSIHSPKRPKSKQTLQNWNLTHSCSSSFRLHAYLFPWIHSILNINEVKISSGLQQSFDWTKRPKLFYPS